MTLDTSYLRARGSLQKATVADNRRTAIICNLIREKRTLYTTKKAGGERYLGHELFEGDKYKAAI